MWIKILVCVSIAGLLLWWFKRTRSGAGQPVVLGEQLAAAAKAEALHQARRNLGPSPLAGRAYDQRGELSLYDPAPSTLDGEISKLLEPLLGGSATQRDSFSDSLTMDDQYTLVTFVRRAAVFGLREKSGSWVRKGATALVVLDPERLDVRDALMAAGYLHHAAGRSGDDADALFRQVAAGGGKGASVLRDFAARDRENKALKTAWLADEVEGPKGLGFIGWNAEPYQPSRDLKPLVLRIAELLSADRYEPESVSVADELPGVWLAAPGDQRADRLVRTLKAVGQVAGTLRATGSGPRTGMDVMQTPRIMVWVAEAPDAGTASALAEMARGKRSRDHGLLAVVSGNLFCLVISNVFVKGASAGIETDEDLKRLSAGLLAALEGHASSR
jgi:hypothetical protein